MSLLAHRFPADIERASVVLPTVKCSSCSIEIPVNFLGEHVCNGPPQYDYRASPPDQRATPSSRFAALPRLQRPESPAMLVPPVPGFRIGDVVGPSSPSDSRDPHMSMVSAVPSQWSARDDGSMSPSTPMSPGPIPLPDTTSGGNAGMAGVGRRAFAAAAWSVRAGVALASSSGRGFIHEEPGRSEYSSSPPADSPMMPEARPTGSPSNLAPSPTTGPGRPNRSPTQRGPVIFPKAPLANRKGSRSSSDGHHRSDGSRSGAGSRNGEHGSRPQLERSGSSPAHPGDDKQQNTAFFDRYRQMMRSKSDQTHTSRNNGGAADDATRYSQATSMDEASSLPWATASTTDESEVHTEEFEHNRYPTNGSISSTTSSSTSHRQSGDRQGASSSMDTELVITPSQSWEGGLAERSMGLDPKVLGYTDVVGITEAPGPLALIGEEEEEDTDEGERFMFGAPKPLRTSPSRIPRSSSESTVKNTSPPRSRPGQSPPTRMDPPRMGLPSSPKKSSPPSQRTKRHCARCGDAVGGSRRYVERDGILLCETDWKKMYLPACRRCKLPIEKSAVSSSDGQLKGKWHRACFTCTRCEEPFADDHFYVHDGRPWCRYHYAEENGTLCASSKCRKPIEGPCILAPSSRGDERFHPGHLRCEHRGGASGTQNCKEPMTEYYDVGGERFCEKHAGRARGVAAGGTPRAEKRRTKLIELPRGVIG